MLINQHVFLILIIDTTITLVRRKNKNQLTTLPNQLQRGALLIDKMQ
jgi:hypothetical protein